MNTRSVREYTTFAPQKFLRNWREWLPINQGDLIKVTVLTGYFRVLVSSCS
jgi:hypothetical protein